MDRHTSWTCPASPASRACRTRRRIWRLTSTRRRSAPPAGDRYSSRRSRQVHEVAHHQRGRLRGEPRDQPRHHPGAPRRDPDEREPPRRPAGERSGGRARAPAPRSEPRAPPGAGRGRPGRGGSRRSMRAPDGAFPGAHRGAPDPRGLPPRRAPRRARLAARARPRPASGCARAGSLRRPPRRVVLRPMGRRYAPRADRGRGLAAPAGRRGSRGRDRAIVPPRLRRTWFPLQLSHGARARAADAVRRPGAAGGPRPGNPADRVPRSAGARDRGHRDGGGDMTTAVISVYKVASFPDGGGHFWVYLQYALGLRRLGCDVYWLEQLRPARDPERQTYVISTFQERMKQLGFEGRTLLYTLDGEPRLVGGTWSEAEAVLRRADVVLNFHYAIDPRLLAYARRTALVDIDPGSLQFWMSTGQLNVPAHDCYLTTGETVGTPAARFSDCGLQWTHIRPPVCLDLWPVTYDARAEDFTTVSSWSSASWLKVDRNGETVLLDNTKRVSFLDFVDLPRHTSQPLELALYLLDRDPEGERRVKQAEKDAADRAHLESPGWRVRDSRDVAGSPEAYRAYVQQSRGEFSCAKPSCMEFLNAWVSDRKLCYLTSWQQVVVQHTDRRPYLPHGEGMFRFTSLPEAVEALESIASDYARHCRAARDIAETHFDARRVLDTALNAALSTQPAALQRAGA